ncbi:E3 ubiquitin-protein ligase MARCHF8-like isoform X2 [Phoenix dactylifera]|uniref:E3 ubiquitin-protein ligase MARCHF8-like isoform X2 n=1 Tax=Phoenix dactylifera TaxID=42345 RepID=A0A8B7CKR7_PHODC|nr:E3 ubiquitin-protein ligase MARCHF8-like isoform X2 [Phoenix dactylifera]
MSDEVVVNVDSLVAKAAAALEAGNGAGGDGGVGSGAAASLMLAPEGGVPEIKIFIESPGASASGTKNDSVVQCKICHDEGLESEMETPCGCAGTIKFSHRKCVQKWCDLKGDIICEICHQEYRPNYSVAPESETNRRLNNARFLAFSAGAENDFVPSDSEDEESDRGVSCFRSAGFVVMVLLFIRHLLMIIVDTGLVQDPSSKYFKMFVDFAGFLLPAYVLLRSLCLIQWRRWRRWHRVRY